MNKRIRVIVQQIKKFLEGKYGSSLKAVILYGSHAREAAAEDSDIDLLVVVDDTLDPWQVRRSLDDLLFEILLETGELVSAIVVPHHFYESYDTPFFRNVRREGVRI